MAHPTEWKNSLSTLEFTHNNQRHADWTHTSFELMHGKALLAILTSFENTKFPSVAEKIKNLVTSQEEALAAHELAKSNGRTDKVELHSIQERTNGMDVREWHGRLCEFSRILAVSTGKSLVLRLLQF